MNLLDLNLLSKIKSLELKAKHVIEGFLAGLHKSPFHGFSVEFAEHRQYMPGDEIKRIDWRVYARTDRFYTKLYEEETNMNVFILVDKSKSMDYGLKGLKKYEYASILAVCISYILINQRDKISVFTFSEDISKFLPPSSNFSHLKAIINLLEEEKPDGGTDISKAIKNLTGYVKRKSMIILISDLLTEQKAVLHFIKGLAVQKHDVLVLHILDPSETDFPFKEEMVFKDMENLSEIMISPYIHDSYKKVVHNFIEKYRDEFLKSGIDYNLIKTDEKFDKALIYCLRKRSEISI